MSTFLPAIFSRYGRLDDFGFYLYTRADMVGVIKSGFSYGRPITSLILGESFAAVDRISGFSYLRLLSLVILCITLLIFRKIYFDNLKHLPIWAIPVLMTFLSLPGVWVFMTWAQGLPHFIGLMFAALATMAYFRQRAIVFFFIFSAASMFTYQPFGLLVPILFLLRVLFLARKEYVKDFGKLFSWALILLILNYLMVRAQPSPNVRSEITADLKGKLNWLIFEWIPRVVFPWDLAHKDFFAYFSLILFILISLIYVSKYSAKKFLCILLFMAFPSIPFIVSSDNWASSRAILASNIAYGAVNIFMVLEIKSRIPFKNAIRTLTALCSLALFLLAIFQGYSGLVMPQTVEWSNTLKAVNSVQKEVKIVSTSLTFFEQTSSSVVSYDEFGVLNSSVETPLRGMISMALAESGVTNVQILISDKRECQRKPSSFEKETGTLFLRPIAGMKGC
jgi:hypothetical protein